MRIRVGSALWASPSARIALGLLVGQAAVYGATPIISRLYTPGEVGRGGVFLASVSVLGALSTLRWEARLASCSDDEAVPVSRVGLWSVLSISLVAGLISQTVLTAGEALLFMTAVASLGLIALGTQWSARVDNMTGLSWSKVAQGLTQAAAQVGAGAAGTTRIGLQLGIAAGYGLSAATQWSGLARSRVLTRWTREGRRLPRTMWIASLSLTLATAINLGTVWAQLFIVSRGFDAATVGQYSLAQRLSIAPAGLAVAALSPPLIAKVGSRLRAQEDAWPPVRRLLILLTPVTLLVALVLVMLPVSAVTAVLGDEWGPVKLYAAALAPLILGLVVVGPVSQVLAVMGRTALQLAWDVSRATAVFGVGFLMIAAGSSAVTTVAVMSSILLLWYIAYVGLVRFSRPNQKEAQ